MRTSSNSSKCWPLPERGGLRVKIHSQICCFLQGSVHAVAGVLYYYGILSIRSVAEYSERRESRPADTNRFVGKANRLGYAIPPCT